MIILVRHGEATHHTRHLTGGWTDSELTNLGKHQMVLTGNTLAKYFSRELLYSPVRILTSDLRRAYQSATIIAKSINFSKQIEKFSFLREKCNGEAANLTENDAQKIYSPPFDEKDIDHKNYPGGETRREFFIRTIEGFNKIVNQERSNVVVVAHKGTIQNLVFNWMGLNIENIVKNNFSIDVLPASISILDINKWNENTLVVLNDTSHLRNK